jgi:hypothetical protein
VSVLVQQVEKGRDSVLPLAKKAVVHSTQDPPGRARLRQIPESLLNNDSSSSSTYTEDQKGDVRKTSGHPQRPGHVSEVEKTFRIEKPQEDNPPATFGVVRHDRRQERTVSSPKGSAILPTANHDNESTWYSFWR